MGNQVIQTWPAHETVARRGMVAAGHPLAAAIGWDVLKNGGNAVDAALAVAGMTSVVMPDMCGPGGDAFVIGFDANSGSVWAVGGSGPVGAMATRDFYVGLGYTSMPLEGIHSVAVPGTVAVWEALARRFGTRPLADLLKPAVHYARHGFPVSKRLADSIDNEQAKIKRFPDAAGVFLPNGQPPAVGELLVQRDLADSLDAISAGGAAVFYKGKIARALVEFSRRSGGFFTGAELADFQADVYAPPFVEYAGCRVYQTAPPSQGLILLEALALLNAISGREISPLRDWKPFTPETIHRQVEATKLAFADRLAFVGDPHHINFAYQQLYSSAYARRRSRAFNPHRATSRVGPGDPGGQTTSFVVVDAQGNAVSFIHSLSLAFGSGVVIPSTGILLNNRAGRGFTLEAGHPNCIAPGKRTMHTLNTYLVTRDGRPVIVGNTPGGDGQPQWNLQVLSYLLDFGMTPQQAVSAPRWTLRPGTDPATLDHPPSLDLEDRLEDETFLTLQAIGHPVKRIGAWSAGGAAQVIRLDPDGLMLGGSDPRSEGLVMGL